MCIKNKPKENYKLIKLTKKDYISIAQAIDNEISDGVYYKDFVVVDIKNKSYILAYEATTMIDDDRIIKLQYAGLKPIFEDTPNDFSQEVLDKYIN